MDISQFIIVVLVGMIGGFFNVYVGAGSLLTIPVLIVLGLPPHIAIASNRLGVIGSDIAGWYEFHVKKMIDYKAGVIIAIPSLAGAIIGANLMLEFDERSLKKIIGIVTSLVLVLIMYKPDVGIKKPKHSIKKHHYMTAVVLSLIVGIYGGFYGAGAGTFLFYILILILGETFLESAGTHEMANLSFSLTAAVIFAAKGVIDYTWAAPLFIGSFTGSYVSAYYSERIGNVFLKRLFFIVVILLLVKLFI